MNIDRIKPTNERVERAIRSASDETGTSFEYLVSTAYRESTFRPDLRATTSTATGLFQFLEQTWFGLVKEDGPSVGLGEQAAAITKEPGGRYTVADAAREQEILALRTDPALSSFMAAKFAQRNAAHLEKAIGRAPTEAELYVAHVLGPTGGAKLIRLNQDSPETVAAPFYPSAAAANQGIFYNRDGSPRTVAQVFQFLTKNHTGTPIAADPVANRIAAGHRAVTGTAPMPAAVAEALRTRALARGDAGPLVIDPRETAAVAATRTAGDRPQEGTAPGGWRARAPADAFAGLMRTDDASAAAPRFRAASILGYSELPAGTAPPSRYAAAGAASLSAPALAPVAGAMEASRPSRYSSRSLAGGAPAAPLPMVTSPLGVARPSRFSVVALVDPRPVPISTTAIAVAPTVREAPSAVAAADPPKTYRQPLSILPPVIARTGR